MTAPIARRASSIEQRPPVDDRRQRRRGRARSSGGPARGGRRTASGAASSPASVRHARASRTTRSPRPGGTPPPPGEAEEVGEQVRAVGREHGLGVELDALDRQRPVAQAHDHAVLGARRGHVQVGGQRRGIHAQRVVAGRREVCGHPRQQARRRRGSTSRRLAVDERRRADDRGARTPRPSTASPGTRRAAGSAAPRRPGSSSTDTPAVSGSPGPGEMTMPRRSAAGSSASASIPARGDRVVAHDAHVRPGGLERLHEVERERVVVVDHRGSSGGRLASAGPRAVAGRGRPRAARPPARRRQLDRPSHRRGLVLGLLELATPARSWRRSRHRCGRAPGRP